MNAEITIIDKGRGPQLSTSRITVQDILPYFELNYSYDDIRQIMPSLSEAEIQAVERYIDEHGRMFWRKTAGFASATPRTVTPRELRSCCANLARSDWLSRKSSATIDPRTATVQGILSDVNIRGQVDFLVAVMQSGSWKSTWQELNLKYVTFADVGLDPSANDAVV